MLLWNIYQTSVYPSHLQSLTDLQCLKHLRLNCARTSITPFLKESKSIATLQYLLLQRMTADNAFFTALGGYKNMRHITFKYVNVICPTIEGLDNEWLCALVANLPELSLVNLLNMPFVLDDVTYLRLVHIVTRRWNRVTLKINTDSPLCVDIQIFKKNKNLVDYRFLNPEPFNLYYS